jgi:hydroxypyruvate isomerase
MQRFKQSVAWWSFVRGEMTPERFVRTLAEIGYDAVELVEPEYWMLVKEHGLKIASIAGHHSIEEGLNRRENHARIEQEILASLELAVKWDIPNLICFSGNRDGLADNIGAEQTALGLHRVAKVAEEAGVTLILELLNSKIDHPDYQCDRTAWGVEVCTLVNSPRVKLLYDVYHMQIMEGDLIRTIRQHHQHIGHYHIAGNPGRHDPDTHQEIYYPELFRTIVWTGFTGYVGHEYIPRKGVADALRASFALGKFPT